MSDDIVEDKITRDINKAVAKRDFRLYSLGGRVPNLPGINNNELEELTSKCGKRIMENTSDILKQDEDLKQLELAYQYAKNYNEKMKLFCKNS